MDEAPSEQSPKGIATALGYRYIALLIADVAAIVTELERNGVSIAVPMTQLGNGAAIVMVEDPDGNIVEFVQEAVLL
ncbi:MAG: VOC family protein [Cyanobacteria bacterium J06626_18]